MPAPRTPRHAWIDQGLRTLAAGGPDAVRIEVLAKALGVTKGGFYGYFADREALLSEMLEVWEREVTEAVIDRVEAPGGTARDRLSRLRSLVFPGDGPTVGPTVGITLELTIRDWARRDAAVAERLRRVDNRRMDYLRSLYREMFPADDEDEAEARSLVSYSLWIGRHLITADNGTGDPARVDKLISQRFFS
ncbi:TetR/AcrR family transcriptional regulator [Catenulispora subtropica]|uniref:TetR/AcrR family transcriptional regulator n=1 Tax=Catenulispora subtropica TaxID=450798 RepID=A0ABP5BVH2_9ACTN